MIIGTVATLAILVFIFGQLFGVFAEGDKVAVVSTGPDKVCGTEDDTGIHIGGEVRCSVIEIADTVAVSSGECGTIYKILGSGVMTTINNGRDKSILKVGESCIPHETLCNTPSAILQAKGLSTTILTCEDIPLVKSNCYMDECTRRVTCPSGYLTCPEKYPCEKCDETRPVSQLFIDQHQCSREFLIDGKVYENTPDYAIDNRLTHKSSLTRYTKCGPTGYQDCNPLFWKCDSFLKRIDFIVLPKIMEAECDSTTDCIRIACGQDIPQEECVKYICYNSECVLEVPVTTTTTIPEEPTTTTIPTTTTTTIPDDEVKTGAMIWLVIATIVIFGLGIFGVIKLIKRRK